MHMSGIKILLVSPLPPPLGGIATWTKKYIDWCKEMHISVDIVNTALTGNRAAQINTKRNTLDEIKRTISIFRNLKYKIKHYRPDVVHLNSSCGTYGMIREYICTLIIGNKGIPVIVHYHCNIKDQIKNKAIQNFFLSRLSKHAIINLVLNLKSQKYLEDKFGIKGKLISNFIDDAFVWENRKTNIRLKSIAFIGHVEKTKGAIEVIQAANYFPHISFILAGPISKSIKMLETPSNVIFKGEINSSEVRNLLRNADAFIFPTYSEGFSVALLEAMAMGLPIITTDVGANASMIGASGGILVRTNNYRDIVNAIKKLENRDYREKMSVWNISRVNKNYLIDIVMKELLEIYKVVLSTK